MSVQQLKFDFHLDPVHKEKAHINLNVAVKPEIYKYIYYKENLEPGTRIPLNRRYSIIMDTLQMMISKPNHQRSSLDMLDSYTKMLKVSGHIAELPYGKFLNSATSIKEFNTMVYKLMIDHLFLQIRMNLILGIPERRTIFEFMEDTGIDDEELGYDSLLKSSQRYRKVLGYGTIKDVADNVLHKVSLIA